MYHLRKIKVLLATCLLACSSLWAQDVKLSLEGASAWASSDQGGNEAASSAIDGDYGKFWHSQWSWGAVFEKESSVDLTIALSEVTLVDYVRYIPRQGSNQGHWGEVEVFYSPNTTGSNFTSIGTFDLKKADIPHDFFLNGTEGVRCGQVKFTIRSGSNNHATAAEIEMYQLDKAKLNAFAQYFTDDVYSELKSGVTSSNGIADGDVKGLVDAMLSDNEYKKFRVGEYEAYETLGTLQQRLKTKNQYSRYENPTGVYFTAGQSYLVAVSGIEDDAVGLKVKNWYLDESSSTYALRNGLNYITAATEGNVFVNYYTDNYAKAPKVKVHFINAPVIGYWDQETMTNSDWVALLDDKASDDHRIIITQSEHAQTAFPISAWKTYCHDDVETLMGHYQDVQWALRDMMGLEKYGYQTRNRQIFYVVNGGFMAAGDEGAYCDYADLGGIMNPNSFDFWGVGHEWGHNNQIHPGFHWSGCGEMTNNIYASWAQYHFTPHRDAAGNPYNLRLEDEKSGIDEYSDMRGGRMQTYFEEALRKGVAWQLQDGPDYHNATPETKTVTGRDADGNDIGEVPTTSRNYDHFVKLTPFWQLNLWGNLAGKCPDIITDVIHSIRTAENYAATYNTNGKQQINWMKLACDHAGIDLLPFFEKAGLLRPIHAYIEDYGAGWNIINEEMINKLKQYVKTKGYPAFTEEINYINAHNMHIYRDNLKLNVTKMQGELNGDKLTIQHSVDGNPLNAVAFETYNAQGELIRITMYGLGSNDEHSFTQVLFPSDADYVMAVGYDGERQKVYQKRTADELQTLINAAQVLIDEVGVVTAEEVNLGTDAYFCNALYTESNNGDKFTSYSVLNDGDHATYLHTDYGATAPDEDHYISVDLGSDNERAYLSLNYVTRKEGNVCAPTKVAIEGSDDETDWVTLNEFVSGLPETNDASQTLNFGNGTSYRYIRMRVYGTNGGQKSNGHHYFIVSELGISAFDVALDQNYLSMSKNVVLAVYMALQSAQNENAYYGLLDKYNALLAAREEMNKLNELKAPLKTLIGSTNSLINECATVTYSETEVVAPIVLKATQTEGYAYLSCPQLYNPNNVNHNNSTDGDVDYNCEQLLDGNIDTYIHTNYSAASSTYPHYLEVAFGTSEIPAKFKFTYTTRSQGANQVPKHIVVKGSNDGVNFDILGEYYSTDEVNPLPTGAGESWTPTEYLNGGYAYLRFEVKASPAGQAGANNTSTPYFAMAAFSMESYTPAGYTVEWKDGQFGNVTEELLIATYEAMQEAQSVVDYANTDAQVNEAIEKLQAQYQALDDAKNSVVYVEYTISTNVAGGGVIYKGEPYTTTTLTAPNTLTTDDLTAIEVEGYVVRSMSIEGTSIIVAYNKIFTVHIVGGEGKGGVTFGGKEYFDGDEFDVEGDFTDDALTVTEVYGYVYDLGVDHITGEIIVIYTVDKSDWSSLVGDVETLINSCYTDGVLNYVNSDFINEDKMTEVRNAIVDAQTQCDNATTLGEYNAAKEALNQAKSTLEMAKASAEAEVIARNEKREALRVLIGQTTDLINLCEENPGDATTALINEVSVAVTLAQSVVDNQGSTEEELNSTIDDLQAEYNVLAAVQQSTAKAELRELIAQTQALIAECGTYGYGEHRVETRVALQTSDDAAAYYLSTNADQNVVGNSKDGDGIAALIDGNVRSYMHTQWSGTAVGEAHYIQVNLGGQGLAEFTFTYATRYVDNAYYNSPAPAVIEVYGCNSESSTKLATFPSDDSDNALPLYTEPGKYWTSATITSNADYEYIRFYVRDSRGPAENTTYGGHHYFGMSEFALNSVSYEPGYYVELPSYSNVTEEQLLAVVIALKEAEALASESYDKAALEDAATSLQALCEELERVHNDYSYLPVTLTTDVENPVLYLMGSQRGAGKVLQYDSEPDRMFSIVDQAEVNVKHLFYFTKGAAKGQVYVHPFTAEGQVLAASDKNEGDAKVSVAEKGDATAMQWTFEQETIEETVWYSLKGVGAPYFSHHGGGANKMGFFGSKDEGSRFTLTETKCHKVTIGQYLHTSLYLDYATTIPEGVKAYIAKNPSEEGTIDLMKLQGNVLPATGVILYSETPGTYYFLATNASATDNVNENLLKGCASEQYVGDETGAKKYYIFGRSGDEVGLYWACMDYTADGTYVGNDEGTHFKASANKVYLELDASQPALSGFRFRVGGDETGIEGITIDADATIYDLYGRRVLEVVTPGLYIINGEKRYINIK